MSGEILRALSNWRFWVILPMLYAARELPDGFLLWDVVLGIPFGAYAMRWVIEHEHHQRVLRRILELGSEMEQRFPWLKG
jgi:hypothetical protein